MKLCKDCKYLGIEYRGVVPQKMCVHPNLLTTNPVSGKSEYRGYWEFAEAANQRTYTKFECIFIKACGKEGKWYESNASNS